MDKTSDELSKEQIEEIIKERDFYKKILNAIPAVVHLNNLSTELVEWINDAGVKLSGYKRDEIVNNPEFFKRAIFEEDLDWVKESIIEYKKDDGVNSYIYSMRNADGTITNYHGLGVVFEYDMDGVPLKNLAIDIDITGEVRNFKQLKRQYQQVCKKLNGSKLETLSCIEIEVLKHICKGKTVKETSEEMKRSRHTIDNHKRNIFKKLGVNKTRQLAAFAKEVGLID